MSVPFTSLSSFTSFPDLDAGPSHQTNQQKQDSDLRKRVKKGEKKDHKLEDKKRRREKYKRGTSSAERPGQFDKHTERRDRYGGVDDERLKAEEDGHSKSALEEDRMVFDPAPLFIIDRKGDPLIVQYGGLHSGDIPRHHLLGRGRKILGLSLAFNVVHRGRHSIEVDIGRTRRMPALTDSSSRYLLNAAPTHRLLTSPENKYKYDEIEGFLRLPSRNHQGHKDDQSYRAIEFASRDADSEGSDTSDGEDESSGEDSDTIPLGSLQATLKSLEERLSSEPTSVSTWLALLSRTLSTVPLTSKNATRTRSDITLSVLSRALSAHPDNTRSRILRLKYLKAGEEQWSEDKLKLEWEDALKVADTELWMEWLDWRIRRGENGTDGVVEDARRVISHFNASHNEIGCIRILWRVAVAFRDAGYVERATALFQAQAELTYHTPQKLTHLPLDKRLDVLEDYWDSEFPRVGEPGATGWAAWETSGRPTYQHSNTSPRKLPESRMSDPLSRWATMELIADRSFQLPTRSTDEENDSDPYSTILFSDIRPLLTTLSSPRAKHTFRLAWICFLGLHIPGFSASLSPDNSDDRWSYTHLTAPSYISSIFPTEENVRLRITADAQAGVVVGREREYTSAFGPVKGWGYGAVRPLDDIMDGKHMWMDEDARAVHQTLAREVFRQCRLSNEDREWDVLAIAFEAAVNPKSATKMSKTLLASARDSLPHWAAHARLERLRGRLDDARKVYETVLTISSSRSGSGALWWDWAEMEWLCGQSTSALRIILRSASVDSTGGVAVLRAKRQLEEAVTGVPAEDWKEREAWVKLRALLELLTVSYDSALSVFEVSLRSLEVSSIPHESLILASLLMLYNHGIVLRNPMPPALLRTRVETAIGLYPSNTAILGIFLEAQKGQSIWGRVRAILGDTSVDGVTQEKDMTRRVAEIWIAGWEKGRWEAEEERTRNGLSAAVQDDRTRGSSILWRLYVEFEIRTGHLQQAKKLLFRAVRECPLVKELYLLAFGALRREFSSRELKGWAETMAERGLRLRQGLEDIVNGDADNQALREGDNEEGTEDEIEYNARELRRLMPY